MSAKKIGRPTDNPRPYNIGVRMNAESKKTLEAYCAQKKVTRTEAVERAIKMLDDDLKK